MKRQLLRALLVAALLCAAVLLAQPTAAWALTGEGTAADPYLISSAADLKAFADKVNGTLTDGTEKNAAAHAKLTADIDLEGSADNQWTPIGSYENQYTGTFDGAGHTISGLHINNFTADCVGLFGRIGADGTVKDLTLADSSITGRYYVGGICGWNYGSIIDCSNSGTVSGGSNVGSICGYNNGSIEGCQNSGAVSGIGSGDYIGGICGNNEGGRIEGCSNSGSVTGSGNVGGICGKILNDGEKTSISNCENSGAVTGSDGSTVGGICGAIENGAGNVSISIEECKNTSTISGGSTVGGICGAIENNADNVSISISIEGCSNSGDVTGSGGANSYAGGICGFGSGSIEGCSNSGDVTGDYNVGGICGMNAGSIEGCENSDTSTVEGDTVGGICGQNDTGGSISDCENIATGTVNGSGVVGGICGENYGSIEGCSNSGTVTGSECVGGICGLNSSIISNCNNSATVTGSGICGWNAHRISNCYWLDSSAGQGVGSGDGSGATMKSADEFASGEVTWLLNQGQEDGPWRQNLGEGGDDYPTLDETHGIVVQLTFHANTGAEGEQSDRCYGNAGASLPTPTRPGYTFEGWYNNADLSGSPVETIPDTVTGNQTYWAKWTEAPSGPTTYQVVIDSDVTGGTVTASPRWAARGDTVFLTATADEGYELSALSVSDRNGEAITLDNEGGGVYSFTMPVGRVTVTATFDKAVITLPFTDVHPGDWFYDPVCFVYSQGLMTGTSATTFEPNTSLSRAMIVAVLYRLEGSPAVSGGHFSDVAEGDWYAQAVNWAASVGVVNGFEDSTFQPNAAITREQLAAILHNYDAKLAQTGAQYKGMDVSTSGDLSTYTDAASVSDWAKDSMQWAVEQGLISGMTVDTLQPQGLSTRAQVAAVLQRYLAN